MGFMIKRDCLALIFFFYFGALPPYLFCQARNDIYTRIDSLKELYVSEPNDSLKLRHFTLMARDYRFINVDSSIFYLKKSIALHREKKVNKRYYVFAYNVLADIFRVELKIDSALFYYEEAYQLFSRDRDQSSLLALAPAYGNVLVKNNQVQKGIDIIQEAIAIANAKQANRHLSMLYVSMGNILQSVQKDNFRAKNIFFKGLVTSENLEEEYFNRINSALNLGLSKVYLEEGKMDSSILHAQRAIDQAIKVNYFQKVIVGYNVLCEIYIFLQKIDQAKRYNELAIQYFSTARDLSAIIHTKVLSLAILLHEGSYRQCILQGNRLLEVHAEKLIPETKKKIYNYLFSAYLALDSKVEIAQAKDSILHYTNQINSAKQNALLADLYDQILIQEQKAANEILLIQKEENEKRLIIRNIAVFSFLVAFLFAIALALTGYRLYKQKDKLARKLEITVRERTLELEKLNEDLIQTNYELRSLSYVASHDLKEPIITIGSFIGLIYQKLPSELQSALATEFTVIQKGTKQLSTLIEDYAHYINFSKSEFLELEPIDLEEVLEAIRGEILSKNTYHNAVIKFNDLGIIHSNKAALYYILKNLIENALKFNDSLEPLAIITLKEGENDRQIWVEDNGIGIEEEHQEKIFGMYKRLNNRANYDGTGLGLSIAKILTHKLNGKIELHSVLNEGSKFILSLPKKT